MPVWENRFIQPNKFSRPQEKLIEVRKIVIHWTANYGASADNHYRYFNSLSGRFASAHLFVDKKEALCIIPLNEITYHANDGIYKGIPELRPNANYLSIGIEMCVEKDGTFHSDTIKRTEDVAVELCKMYNLNPIKDIVRHYDITKKSCPTPWVRNPKELEDFKIRVNDKLNIKEISIEKEISNMKFTSPTLRDQLEMRLKSPATAKLIDDYAQKLLGYQTKLVDGKLNDGDLLAICTEIAVECAKKHK